MSLGCNVDLDPCSGEEAYNSLYLGGVPGILFLKELSMYVHVHG